MFQTISNKALTVTVRELGAELWSIRQETEYLWQGDQAYWKGRSTTIFPYVARLNGGCYTLNGHLYRLPIHGFASHCLFTAVENTGDSVTLELTDSRLTLALYPCPFVFRVKYSLVGSRLDIVYSVRNTGTERMYFGLGGHPGFHVPLEDGFAFEDYALHFESPCRPKRVLFTPDCFVTGKEEPFPLEGGTKLKLTHSLFDDDAIVLRNMAGCVTLKAEGAKRGVRLTYPKMPYLGLWHVPHKAAPYVCIEPWSSLPAAKGAITELSRQPDLIFADPGEEYVNAWSIEMLH